MKKNNVKKENKIETQFYSKQDLNQLRSIVNFNNLIFDSVKSETKEDLVTTKYTQTDKKNFQNIINNKFKTSEYVSNKRDKIEKINKPYNNILSQQIITSNMMQIYTESAAFIIILFSLISLITNITETSFANSATSLAILSRMVPSFTRCISFFTQLQFGVPCVRRLSHIYKL